MKYWALRLAAMVVPRLPREVAERGGMLLGLLMWLSPGPLRRRATDNLRHVPTLANDPRRLRGAVRGVFLHAALNYVDFLRGPSLTDQELLSGWTIEGEDIFQSRVDEGRGLVILAGHFGNFERAISRAGALGYPMVTPAEHLEPERLFQLFCRIRTHHRMRLVPADRRDSLRELFGALKRGEVVAMAADRHIIGASQEVPLFGTPVRLPTGPFSLALRSGAPIVVGLSWRTGRRRAHGIFAAIETASEDGSTVPDGGAPARPTEAALIAGLQRQFVAVLERQIAAHPEQWVSALSPVWDEAGES